MTIDGVKRTAQQQVNKALKDRARFVIYLNFEVRIGHLCAPDIFCPANKQI